MMILSLFGCFYSAALWGGEGEESGSPAESSSRVETPEDGRDDSSARAIPMVPPKTKEASQSPTGKEDGKEEAKPESVTGNNEGTSGNGTQNVTQPSPQEDQKAQEAVVQEGVKEVRESKEEEAVAQETTQETKGTEEPQLAKPVEEKRVGDEKKVEAAIPVETPPSPQPSEPEKSSQVTPPPAQGAVATTPSEPMIPLGEVVAPTLPASELELLEVIRQRLTEKGQGSKKIIAVVPRAAALEALHRNLSVKIAERNKDIAQAVFMEAKAAFMPDFSFTWSRSDKRTHLRKVRGPVFHPQIPFGRGNKFNPDQLIWYGTDKVSVDVELAPGASPVKYIDFHPGQPSWWEDGQSINRETGQISEPGVIEVSKGMGSGPDVTLSGVLRIAQALPWGPEITLSETVSHHERPYDKFNHRYGYPWTSSFLATVYLPLPFTKNFGPYSPRDTSFKMARLAKDKVYWQTKATIETTLLEVHLAYWNLVGSLKTLQATIEVRKQIEKIAEMTGKLLEAKRTTAYGKSQIETELARVRGEEEKAWLSLDTASHQLAHLLDMDEEILFLPAHYTSILTTLGEIPSRSEAVQTGLENRPELKAQGIQVQSALVWMKYARVQTRQDIALQGSMLLAQDGSVIGYPTIDQSIGQTFNPDQKTQNYGGTWNYAIGNKVATARYHRAKTLLEQEEISEAKLKDQIRQEIEDALARVYASRARLAALRAQEEAARQAFLQALQLREADRMNEFELIEKSQELLQATSAVAEEAVLHKQAEAYFYYTQGALAKRYAELTALNSFDAQRVAMLANLQALEFF